MFIFCRFIDNRYDGGKKLTAKRKSICNFIICVSAFSDRETKFNQQTEKEEDD